LESLRSTGRLLPGPDIRTPIHTIAKAAHIQINPVVVCDGDLRITRAQPHAFEQPCISHKSA